MAGRPILRWKQQPETAIAQSNVLVVATLSGAVMLAGLGISLLAVIFGAPGEFTGTIILISLLIGLSCGIWVPAIAIMHTFRSACQVRVVEVGEEAVCVTVGGFMGYAMQARYAFSEVAWYRGSVRDDSLYGGFGAPDTEAIVLYVKPTASAVLGLTGPLSIAMPRNVDMAADLAVALRMRVGPGQSMSILGRQCGRVQATVASFSYPPGKLGFWGWTYGRPRRVRNVSLDADFTVRFWQE